MKKLPSLVPYNGLVKMGVLHRITKRMLYFNGNDNN